MTRFLYSLVLLSVFLTGLASAQPLHRLDILSRAQPGRLLLRWKPSTPDAWINGNGAGYTITRTTVSSTSATPSPTKTITVAGIKAADQSRWQPYLDQDSTWHQVLYYLTVNDQRMLNPPVLADTARQNTPSFQLSERYTYVMLAADNRFSAAVMGGLGYIDTDVKAGERYTYTISTSAVVGITPISSGSVSLGLSDYAPLAKPLIDSLWRDSQRVTLRWNADFFKPIYGGYFVERATGTTGPFSRLTDLPFMQLSENTPRLVYPDSLPNLNRSYRYRIIGISYFDELQASDPVSVTTTQQQQANPGIQSVGSVGSRYNIQWRYPIGGTNTRLDTLLQGFQLSVSNRDAGPYQALGSPVGYAVTSLSITKAGLAALVDTTQQFFIRVSATGLSGDVTHSLPYVLIPFDRTGPAAPKNVTAVEVSVAPGTDQQLVRVSWQPNTEPDLRGYKVFRQIGQEPELMEVSGGIRPQAFIVDTLSRRMGLPVVKYFVWAFDSSFHQSESYGLGLFRQPDTTAPLPPFLTGFAPAEVGVTLFWDPSPESRMVPIVHKLLRRDLASESLWQEVRVMAAGDTITRFTDPGVVAEKTYVYSMLAIDASGNTSCYRKPTDCYQLLVVRVPRPARLSLPDSFTARYDTLSQQVVLGWVTSQTGVQTFELYRGLLGTTPTGWQVIDGITYSATDATVEPGRTYVYQLRALSSDNRASAWLPVTVVCSQTATGTNLAPTQAQALPIQYAVAGTSLTYSVPFTAFSDTDGQVISVLLTGNPPPGIGLSTNQLQGTPTLPGTYTVLVIATDNNGATHQTNLIVQVEAPLAAPTLLGTVTLCQGQSAQLTATDCPGTVVWSTGATGSPLTYVPASTPLMPTALTLTARCQTARQQSGYARPYTLWLIPALAAPQLASSTLCQDGSVTLKPTSWSGLVRWSGGFQSKQWTVSPAQTTVYSATNVLSGCVSPPAQVTVTVTPPPGLTLLGATALCSGGPTTLTALTTGAISYSWTTPSGAAQTGATTPMLTVSQTGTYGITVQSPGGCLAQKSLAITNAPTLTATIAGTTALCSGAVGQLTASGGSTYRWSTGATTATLSVSVSGPYSVTVFSGASCAASISVAVQTGTPPVAPLVASTTLCPGGSATLTASGCTGQVLWSTGATGTSLTTPTLTQTTTYTATCSTGGCVSTPAVATVTVGSSATASIAGNLSLCAGQSTTLIASSGTTYSWNTGATTASISVSAAGPYSLTVSDGQGCIAFASTTVSTGSSLSISITGNVSLCAGQSGTLIASGGSTYRWSTGPTTASLPISATGLYSLTALSAGGCSGFASATVGNSPAFTATIAGNVSLCAGGITTLTAVGGSAGVSYRWSTNETTAAISVSVAGPYSATLLNVAGCSSVASATLTNRPSFTATLTAMPSQSVCPGGSVTLTASGGTTGATLAYRWTSGASSVSLVVAPQSTTAYSVTISDGSTCTVVQSLTLTTAPIIVAVNSATPDASVLFSLKAPGGNLAQNNTFVDGSANSLAVTRTGGTSQGSFGPAAGLGSAYFNGSGGLSIPHNAQTNTQADFTWETWFYPTPQTAVGVPLMTKGWPNPGAGGPLIYYNGNGQIVFYASTNGSYWDIASDLLIGQAQLNVWQHVAVSRQGSTYRLFYNGVQVNTISNGANIFISGSPLTIGQGNSGGQNLNGFLAGTRVSNNARYTTTFTPPTSYSSDATTNLLLTYGNAGAVDITKRNVVETGGDVRISTAQQPLGQNVVAFDGAGDYLRTATSPNYSLGTGDWTGNGDFTFDGWVYQPSVTGDVCLVDTRSGGEGIGLYTSTSTAIRRMSYANNTAILATATVEIPLNEWTHVAVQRRGGVVTGYQNGKQVFSVADTRTMAPLTNVVVGSLNTTASQFFTGSMYDLRLTKAARYTCDFVVPVIP